MGSILVTGGAGYVGSHIVRALRESGRDHVVIDDLSEGHREAVEGSPLEVMSIADRDAVTGLLKRYDVEWIVHMAAHSLVAESMADPPKYWRNNVSGSLALLDAARKARVRGLVFSSTAAVYGEPAGVPIEESHPCRPTNVYGETKFLIERTLEAYEGEYGFLSASLRYFNAAGASSDGTIGEDHARESHLVPLAIGAAAGRRPPLTILGTDYQTPDGTGIRDYVHVEDLAEAHLLALGALERGAVRSGAVNLGGGEGRSVRQVLDAVRDVTGRAVPAREGPRRPGDPAVLVASNRLARETLGWRPRRSSLERIVETAWAWHREHPDGFSG